MPFEGVYPFTPFSDTPRFLATHEPPFLKVNTNPMLKERYCSYTYHILSSFWDDGLKWRIISGGCKTTRWRMWPIWSLKQACDIATFPFKALLGEFVKGEFRPHFEMYSDITILILGLLLAFGRLEGNSGQSNLRICWKGNFRWPRSAWFLARWPQTNWFSLPSQHHPCSSWQRFWKGKASKLPAKKWRNACCQPSRWTGASGHLFKQ